MPGAVRTDKGLWIIGAFAVAFLAVLFGTSRCGTSICPDPVHNWEDRQLSVEDMERLKDDWPEDIGDHECGPTALGVDERFGQPVYVESLCDDLCPEYNRLELTYGPSMTQDQCADLSGCWIINRASMRYMRCVPICGPY